MLSPRTRRFWLGYALAWLPVLAIYLFAFQLEGSLPGLHAVLAATGSVLPDALLGVGVVHVCRRLWHRPASWLRVLGLAACGAGYVLAATALKLTASLLVIRGTGRELSLAEYDLAVLLWQGFFSLLAYAVLISVTLALATAERLRAEEARRTEADLLRTRSELKALRAQFNPHFLFNTLHSVQALVATDPRAAEGALEQLGDLLRYSLRTLEASEEGVLLSEEWSFVRTYLAIEKLRLGERLRVREELGPGALESVVPALVLQPLVENAVLHGISVRASGGTLTLRARRTDSGLELEVQDDGPGSRATTHGTGKGLELVRARVRALYGEGGVVTVRAGLDGFHVRLSLADLEDVA